MLDRDDTNISVFDPDMDDVAFMLYTSGSADEPKGVPHRHGDMPFTIEAFDGNVTRLTENGLMFM